MQLSYPLLRGYTRDAYVTVGIDGVDSDNAFLGFETFSDDRIRAVRDRRYKYIRNFRPELPYAQQVAYGELMPTMQAWRRLNAAGELTGPQRLFFSPTKPPEELYDIEADPHEVNNLAASKSPEHQKALTQLRAALDRWADETNDLGAVPERELIQRGLVKDVLQQYEQRKQR